MHSKSTFVQVTVFQEKSHEPKQPNNPLVFINSPRCCAAQSQPQSQYYVSGAVSLMDCASLTVTRGDRAKV